MTSRPFLQAPVLLLLIAPGIRTFPARGASDTEYESFLRLVKDNRNTEALDLGGRLVRLAAAQNPDAAAFALVAQRLDAAQQIGTQVARVCKPSQTLLLDGLAGIDGPKPASPAAQGQDRFAVLPPSARELYWTHWSVFTHALVLDDLPAQQAAFLSRYYDLQMQESILKIGRQVIVVEPNPSEDACYAIVLPLLYLHGRDNAWDQMGSFLALFSPLQLDLLWRFSALQAERPQASIQIASYRARAAGQEFSLAAWAADAVDLGLVNHRPDLAQKFLHVARDGVKDPNQSAELWLKVAEGYTRCGDYAAAAQVCKQTADDLPDSPLYGKITAIYLGYLAREGAVDRLITEAESALRDARCEPHVPRILYLRWWALCQVNRHDEAARLAQQLMERHSSHPCVAPVLLERATDALARRQYDRCRELLTRLMKDFPDSECAKPAGDLLATLPKGATP